MVLSSWFDYNGSVGYAAFFVDLSSVHFYASAQSKKNGDDMRRAVYLKMK